ncbi:MAG: hypothetical protein KGH72_02590 [Candidatus Micrarchaeota archaeon]|nr:hypothetical protein [Candidatus Micrarchaeota archaeon]
MVNKAIIAYVALAAVLVVLVFVFLKPSSGYIAVSSTTAPISTVSNITVNSTTMSTSSIPVYNYSGCIQSGAFSPVSNGNFGTGNLMSWNATPNGFVVYNKTSLNANRSYYAAPWNGTNATYFASTYNIGTAVRSGNLTSSTFQIVQPYLRLQIISPQDAQLYVEIINNTSVKKIFYINSYSIANSSNAGSYFQNASIDVIPILCQHVRLRFVAGAVGNIHNVRNYMAITNIRQAKVPQLPGLILNWT